MCNVWQSKRSNKQSQSKDLLQSLCKKICCFNQQDEDLLCEQVQEEDKMLISTYRAPNEPQNPSQIVNDTLRSINTQLRLPNWKQESLCRSQEESGQTVIGAAISPVLSSLGGTVEEINRPLVETNIHGGGKLCRRKVDISKILIHLFLPSSEHRLSQGNNILRSDFIRHEVTTLEKGHVHHKLYKQQVRVSCMLNSVIKYGGKKLK